jgi:hypothetical protein
MTMRYSHLLTEHLHEAVAKAGTKLGTRASDSKEDIAKLGNIRLSTLGFNGPAFSWTATARLENASIYNVVAEPDHQGLEQPGEPC